VFDKEVVDLSEIIEKRKKNSALEELPTPIVMIPMQTRMMYFLEMSYFVGIIAMFAILFIALIYTVVS
jgi:hypothetical protein